MWVFDGERWIEEGTSPRPEQTQKPLDPRGCDEFYPELQIIEVPRVEREYVPFPVLIP